MVCKRQAALQIAKHHSQHGTARRVAAEALSKTAGDGLGGRPVQPPALAAAHPFPIMVCAGAFLGRPPLSTASESLPSQSWRRLVPLALHTAKMSECCFQSPCLPGRTGVHSMSPLIRPSEIHRLTVASVRLAGLLTCKYPEIFARPPSPGTS